MVTALVSTSKPASRARDVVRDDEVRHALRALLGRARDDVVGFRRKADQQGPAARWQAPQSEFAEDVRRLAERQGQLSAFFCTFWRAGSTGV